MEASLIATASATNLEIFLSIFKDLSSVFIFATPLALLIWSYKNSMSYNQDNLTFHTNIEDKLDKKMFKDLAIPLFKALSDNVTQDAYTNTKGTSKSNQKNYLKKYEEEKISLLKMRDYTFIEEAIVFQTAIKGVISSRKNHLEFERLKTESRNLLILSTIISGITSVMAILAIGSNKILPAQFLCDYFFGVWWFCFIINLVVLMIYYNRKLAIDSII